MIYLLEDDSAIRELVVYTLCSTGLEATGFAAPSEFYDAMERALPELLILDEPMSGLDPVNTDLFKDIIREEIGKGKYLIMSSHQMATVEEFCTDITILHRSRALLQGNLNEIKKSHGRVNLRLKTEQDISAYIQKAGITQLSEKEYEYQLKVTGEDQANALLADLMKDSVRVITFDLREPSLHEIFVSTVGGEAHETE